MPVGCGRLAEGKRHETDLFVLSARFVLFRPIKKRSFDLLRVLDHFFQNAGSQLCFRFMYFIFFIKNRLKVGEDEEEESNQSHGLKSDFLTRCDTICMISLCTSAISHYAALRKHFHYFHSDLLHSVSHLKKKDRKVFGCSPQIVRTCPLHFGRLKKLDCSDDI